MGNLRARAVHRVPSTARLIFGLIVFAGMAWLVSDLCQQRDFGVQWLHMSQGFFWLAVGKGALLGIGAVVFVFFIAPALKRTEKST